MTTHARRTLVEGAEGEAARPKSPGGFPFLAPAAAPPLDLIRIGYTPTFTEDYGLDDWDGPYAIIPQTDWPGTADGGTTAYGRQVPCNTPGSGCSFVHWPGSSYNPFWVEHEAAARQTWFGSLIEQMTDATGLMYRRNRYYNPNTGSFTQEDPIGIAGGLNVYGFANGDPITYDDPSGLCPPCAAGGVAATKSAPIWVPVVKVAVVSALGWVLGQYMPRGDVATGTDLPPTAQQDGTSWVVNMASTNQMNREIQRGQAPRGVERVDNGKVTGEQDHVHFDDESALNRDGTWKHGERDLTRAQRDWLKGHGWKLPE